MRQLLSQFFAPVLTYMHVLETCCCVCVMCERDSV